MTSQRLTVQEAADFLGTSVDAVRMRARRGSLASEKEPDGRVYVWVNSDSSETKHEPNGESSALISAKDETIALLREQLEEERRAHSEARRLLAAALERIPPQLEAPAAPESAGEGQEDAEPRSGTPGNQESTIRPPDTAEWPVRGGSLTRPWWRRVFGG